jgi:hypothetical protein
MSEKDFAIGVATLPPVGALAKKPPYLITLEPESGKSKVAKKFITNEKPELLNGFISVKGIYSDAEDDEIIKNYSDLLTNSPKELVLEMMFPWHKICSIRSLIFRAK